MSHSFGSLPTELNAPLTRRLPPRHGRHLCLDEEGTRCITVIDPATCKLLIPLTYVHDTRAQDRSTLPSLCQLFLQGRCRQGAQCYQVHAMPDVVAALRSRVEYLPCCCVRHGDMDRVGVYREKEQGAMRSLREVVLRLPLPGAEAVYLPLDTVSYTVAVRHLLDTQDPLHSARLPLREGAVVLDGSRLTVCRLHAMDRCRYAEECKFLHLCKETTRTYPSLTLTEADQPSSEDGPRRLRPLLHPEGPFYPQSASPSPSYHSYSSHGSYAPHLNSPNRPFQGASLPSSGSSGRSTPLLNPHPSHTGKVLCPTGHSYRFDPYSYNSLILDGGEDVANDF